MSSLVPLLTRRRRHRHKIVSDILRKTAPPSEAPDNTYTKETTIRKHHGHTHGTSPHDVVKETITEKSTSKPLASVAASGPTMSVAPTAAGDHGPEFVKETVTEV